MTRRTLSVVFATVLLLGQLLIGVAARAMPCESGSAHCPGCPPATGFLLGVHGASPHCHAPLVPVHQMPAGCSHGCLMHAGSCGTTCVTALPAASILVPASLLVLGRAEALALHLPDSPLFDLLRPPK